MTIEEISRLAAQNNIPAQDLSVEDWLLWYRLRDLYKTFSAGSIAKEKAAEEKQRIVKQYNQDRQNAQSVTRFMEYHERLWRSIEQAATVYRSDKTIENADKFVETVYGVGMKEE